MGIFFRKSVIQNSWSANFLPFPQTRRQVSAYTWQYPHLSRNYTEVEDTKQAKDARQEKTRRVTARLNKVCSLFSNVLSNEGLLNIVYSIVDAVG